MYIKKRLMLLDSTAGELTNPLVVPVMCSHGNQDGKYEILTNQAYDEAERAGRVKNDKFLNE